MQLAKTHPVTLAVMLLSVVYQVLVLATEQVASTNSAVWNSRVLDNMILRIILVQAQISHKMAGTDFTRIHQLVTLPLSNINLVLVKVMSPAAVLKERVCYLRGGETLIMILVSLGLTPLVATTTKCLD